MISRLSKHYMESQENQDQNQEILHLDEDLGRMAQWDLGDLDYLVDHSLFLVVEVRLFTPTFLTNLHFMGVLLHMAVNHLSLEDHLPMGSHKKVQWYWQAQISHQMLGLETNPEDVRRHLSEGQTRILMIQVTMTMTLNFLMKLILLL